MTFLTAMGYALAVSAVPIGLGTMLLTGGLLGFGLPFLGCYIVSNVLVACDR